MASTPSPSNTQKIVKKEDTSPLAMIPISQSPVRPPSQPTVSNRLTTIGQIRPNYQSALVNPYDPYRRDIQPQSSGQPTTKYKAATPYLQKTSKTLFFIEPCLSHITIPARLAEAYFPPGYHFLPTHPSKNLAFYTDILFATDSVSIKPIYDKNNNSKLIYHSLHILRIISQKDWGTHPSTLKALNSQTKFSYYDYVDAWSNVFWHQTSTFDHSWFVNFDKHFSSQFPVWFIQWWADYGANFDALPSEFQTTVNYFSTQYHPSKENASLPNSLLFSAKYKVPWILKWHFDIHAKEFKRVITVKWWDKFQHDRITTQVYKEFPVN